MNGGNAFKCNQESTSPDSLQALHKASAATLLASFPSLGNSQNLSQKAKTTAVSYSQPKSPLYFNTYTTLKRSGKYFTFNSIRAPRGFSRPKCNFAIPSNTKHDINDKPCRPKSVSQKPTHQRWCLWNSVNSLPCFSKNAYIFPFFLKWRLILHTVEKPFPFSRFLNFSGSQCPYCLTTFHSQKRSTC